MNKTVKEILEAHEVKTATGTTQEHVRHYKWFEGLTTLYSAKRPEGVEITAALETLYYLFVSYNDNGKTCYQAQSTLADYCRCKSRTIRTRITELEDLGLVQVEMKVGPNGTNKYIPLPLQDFHLNAPEAVEAPVTAPEPVQEEVKQTHEEEKKAPEKVVQKTAAAPAQVIMQSIVEVLVTHVNDVRDNESSREWVKRICSECKMNYHEDVHTSFMNQHGHLIEQSAVPF
jgi:hypothetical protein